MIDAVRFLEYVGRLVGDPPSVEAADREELIRDARSRLEALRLADPSADFVLSASGVSWGPRPVELPGGTWLDRLRAEGVAVLAPPNDETGFARWVTRVAGQIAVGEAIPVPCELTSVGASTASPGSAGDAGAGVVIEDHTAADQPFTPAGSPESMAAPEPSVQDEADGVWLFHEAVFQGRHLSFKDVSAIASNLAGLLDRTALAATPEVICTLDEYTTVHSVNVALLSMKLARHLAFDDGEVLSIGIAGLLHDIGKIRLGDLPAVSRQMLSPDEIGVMQTHPAEGARLLLDHGAPFAIAAVVAYEHHMSGQGEGGYPVRHFERSTHPFTRLVAVCDVYDVLRSERSFRPALSVAAATKYLGLLAGQGLDPEVTNAFLDLARGPLPSVKTPLTRPAANPHEIGWLPETSYDPDCEPRPVRL